MRKSLVIGGKLFHMHFCAHITNLMVQDGLGEIGEIVDYVRDEIKFLVASERRLMQFSEIAKNLQLSSKKLFLDVPTRWNNTYLMLAAACESKEVFPRYGYNDCQFTWVPSHENRDKVKSVSEILGVFNRVTKIVSRSDYPTTNLFLPKIRRMKDVLTKKCDDDNDYIKSLARRMKVKFDKYWGECNLLMSIAAILDPRFKIVLIQFCFPKIYQEVEATKNIEYVQRILNEIYDLYVNEHNSNLMKQNLASKVQENFSSNHLICAVDDQVGLKIMSHSSKVLKRCFYLLNQN